MEEEKSLSQMKEALQLFYNQKVVENLDKINKVRKKLLSNMYFCCACC